MNEPDQRKDVRRDHINKKKLDKENKNIEYRDQQRLKKQFKKQKEIMRQDELWDEWENEIH